jgi:polar amino acid transport system substrate-binding protein
VSDDLRSDSDPRVADLVQAGKLRLALFAPMQTRDPVTGGIRRAAHLMETASALARRLRIELEVVDLASPVDAMESLNAGVCDVSFTGIEMSRAAQVSLSPPLFELDFTFLVPAGSRIRRLADADRPGVRIAVVRHHISTLTLNRTARHAELAYAETPEHAFELLRTARAEAWASVGFVLREYSARLPGSRVLEGRYGENVLAMAVAKHRAARLAYVAEFVEEIKASGFAQRAVELSGFRGLRVATNGRRER